MKIIAPRGTKDILPEDSSVVRNIEKKAHELFNSYNYKEIRTPIFEQQTLFERSLGATTDIIQKQLLALQPAGESENKFALRPEATASIVRAYIEHSLDKKESYSKCYYIGSMFRGERPQKGRLRQFNHIGVEVIGNKNPYVDVEVISLASNLLTSFGVNDYKIRINNLGCAKDRLAWSKLLKKYLESKKDKLCGLCQQRFDRNVFRILDCKNKDCISLVKGLKVKEQHICKECTSFSDLVLKGLKQLNIAFELDP